MPTYNIFINKDWPNRGERKSSKGITGGYAPQWMIDKVKPLMKEGQYWVQIDEQGNIIE